MYLAAGKQLLWTPKDAYSYIHITAWGSPGKLLQMVWKSY